MFKSTVKSVVMAYRPNSDWKHGLLNELSNPRKWILQSENVVVVQDKFPKAMYHFLVLPKEQIPSIFEVRLQCIVCSVFMQNSFKSNENFANFCIRKLTKADLNLLHEMFLMALNIIRTKGRTIDEFKIGYHAEPSLLQLHLHVISTDFHSSTLKTKRHWNSFNTKLFIPHRGETALYRMFNEKIQPSLS